MYGSPWPTEPELRPDTHWPNVAEEAAINAGIAADPDTFEASDEWFATAHPATEVLPDIAEWHRREQAKGKAPIAE